MDSAKGEEVLGELQSFHFVTCSEVSLYKSSGVPFAFAEHALGGVC